MMCKCSYINTLKIITQMKTIYEIQINDTLPYTKTWDKKTHFRDKKTGNVFPDRMQRMNSGG